MKNKLLLSFMAVLIVTAFILQNVQANQSEKVTILLYHHLLTAEELQRQPADVQQNESIITVEAFAEQMQYLYENGYRSITMAELDQFLSQGQPVPEKAVMITFDDGYLSNYHHAYPILKQYGFSGVLFAVTALLQEESQDWNPDQIQFLSQEQMQAMADVFEYGSHTHDMHRLVDGKAQIRVLTKDEVVQDLTTSRNILNQTPYFAYPYGEGDRTTTAIMKSMDFQLVFITEPGHVFKNANRYRINRNSISPKTTMEEFIKKLG